MMEGFLGKPDVSDPGVCPKRTLREINEEIWSSRIRTSSASIYLEYGSLRFHIEDARARKDVYHPGMYITEFPFFSPSKVYLGINTKYKASKGANIRNRIYRQGSQVLTPWTCHDGGHQSFIDKPEGMFEDFKFHYITFWDPIFEELDRDHNGIITSLESDAIIYLKTCYPSRVLNIA
tara:strand:- start:126 stop:659 length:534 start_codon:yes stop_codon:yes gene_type:complete